MDVQKRNCDLFPIPVISFQLMRVRLAVGNAHQRSPDAQRGSYGVTKRVIATATVGEGGWVDVPEPTIVRAGDGFVAGPEEKA